MTHDLKATARGYLTEIVGRGQVELWDRYLADTVHFNGQPMTRETMAPLLAGFQSAFPDFSVTVDDQIGEGDRVVSRVTFRGTHRGIFMGIPASGRSIEYRGMAFDRFEDGRLVEAWHEADLWGLAEQLKGNDE